MSHFLNISIKKKRKSQELPLKDILEILSYKYIDFFINLTLE